nr:MarR family winged helix-turn-helix transcriptional regulator [Rhizobium rhizoryzae]
MERIKPQLTNLLGALSLALADAQLEAVKQAGGIGTAACATLVALGHSCELTIRELAVIAGLSHSVMVRSIENLAQAGLVAKSQGKDKREVLTRLTPQGLELRTQLLDARAAQIQKALAALSLQQQISLHEALSVMLVTLTEGRDQSEHLCRLCDEAACGPDCPVELCVQQMEKPEVV